MQKVYFTGQDQRGNFRVGDKFLVDLENERTSFDVESIFADNTKVQIRQGNDVVTLEPGRVGLDNIVIQGNVIEATRSAINFDSVGNIVFQGNVNAPSVDITGNLSIGGALTTIGDAPSDTVDFNTNISQNFEPGSTEGLTLGTASKRWKELHTKTAVINSISISSQTIATNESNADLYITAKGTGKVRVENLEFEDNKIIGKFSPEGEFIVTDYELSTPAIFNGFLAYKTQLPKYTTVLVFLF